MKRFYRSTQGRKRLQGKRRLILKINPGRLRQRHPFRNMDDGTVWPLDNEDRLLGKSVTPMEAHRGPRQGMKSVVDGDFIRAKTGSMGPPRTAVSGTPCWTSVPSSAAWSATGTGSTTRR